MGRDVLPLAEVYKEGRESGGMDHMTSVGRRCARLDKFEAQQAEEERRSHSCGTGQCTVYAPEEREGMSVN